MKYMKSSMMRTEDGIREQSEQIRNELLSLWLHIANLKVGDYRPILDYLAQ